MQLIFAECKELVIPRETGDPITRCHVGSMNIVKYYVYILSSKRNDTLYVGMTNSLRNRMEQHRLGKNPGFTQRYNVKMLVYFEEHYDPRDAIAREKQLKWWRRKWKLELIESMNPDWKDMADGL